MTKPNESIQLHKLNQAIKQVTDKRVLNLLNLAWWKEYFKLNEKQ